MAYSLHHQLNVSAIVTFLALIFAAISPGTAQVTALTNPTIVDPLVIEDGERVIAKGTITLQDSIIDVAGELVSESLLGVTSVQGAGDILLRPRGNWESSASNIALRIGSGVTVTGDPGSDFIAREILNQGTLRSSTLKNQFPRFDIFVDRFENEGTITAAQGSRLAFFGVEEFNNLGTIIIEEDATLQLNLDSQGNSFSLGDFGSTENHGTFQIQSADFDLAGEPFVFEDGHWVFAADGGFRDGTIVIPPTSNVSIGSTSGGSSLSQFVFSNTTVSGSIESIGPNQTVVSDGLTLEGVWGVHDRVDIKFSGDQTVLGNAVFSGAAEDRDPRFAGNIVADAGVTTLPANVTLTSESRSVLGVQSTNGGSFLFDGIAEADGGTLIIDTPDFKNRGNIRVANQGALILNSDLDNEGTVEVSNGIVTFDGPLPIVGSGTVSIQDSVLAFGPNTSIADLNAVPGTNLTYAYAGETPFDLEGNTLSIADVDGQRWAIGSGRFAIGDNFTTGGYTNGAIESVDGFELSTVDLPGAPYQPSQLQNIELNANLRINEGTYLAIDETLEGVGRLIVDGGDLIIGNPYSSERSNTMVDSQVFDRVDHIRGSVSIHGGLNNTGRTISIGEGMTLEFGSLSGKYWQHGAIENGSPGIIGGRIEGESGAVLRPLSFGGDVGGFGLLQGVTLATTTMPINRDDGLNVGSVVSTDGLTLENSTIELGSLQEYAFVDLVFAGDQLFSGTGSVLFKSPPSVSGFLNTRSNTIGAIGLGETGGSLTIGPGIEIMASEGSGRIAGIQIVNHGLIQVENGQEVEIQLSMFDQRGTLSVAAGSKLEFARGEAVFNEAATTKLQVDALSAEANILIQADVDVQLGGVLELWEGANLLALGESATLISGASTGIFEQVFGIENRSGLSLAVTYGDDSVLVTGAQPGDLNLDGQVDVFGDGFTLIQYLGSSGATWSQGDFNGDGQVDVFGDAFVLLGNLPNNAAGDTATSRTSSAVPEPENLTLLALAGIGFFLRRRQPKILGGVRGCQFPKHLSQAHTAITQ